MDPLTHLVSGAVSGHAANGGREGQPGVRGLSIFCALAAASPDIDILVGSDPVINLTLRRGVTHSVFGTLVMALIFAVVGRKIWPRAKFMWLYGLTLAMLWLHIFFDLINSYGVQILAPLSNHRFALDAIFIIDPLLTFPVLACVIGAAISTSWRRRFGIIGVAWCLGWPTLAIVTRQILQAKIAGDMAGELKDGEEVIVSSDAFSPVRWKIVTRTPTQIRIEGYDIFSGLSGKPSSWYTRADLGELQAFGRFHRIFPVYAWFAQYPVRLERMEEARGREIEWRDLRFASMVDWVRELREPGPNADKALTRSPFTVVAFLDAHGELLKWGWASGSGVLRVMDPPLASSP